MSKYIIFRIIHRNEGEILKFLQVIIIFYRVESLNKLKCDSINDINNVKVYNIYNIYKVILFLGILILKCWEKEILFMNIEYV